MLSQSRKLQMGIGFIVLILLLSIPQNNEIGSNQKPSSENIQEGIYYASPDGSNPLGKCTVESFKNYRNGDFVVTYYELNEPIATCLYYHESSSSEEFNIDCDNEEFLTDSGDGFKYQCVTN